MKAMVVESLDWARDAVAAMDEPYKILDMVAKRNVVFVSWQLGEETGTWVMGFERDGSLSQFTPIS